MANADESKKATALTCGGPPPVVCTGVRVKISNLNVFLTSVKQNHFDEQSQKKKIISGMGRSAQSQRRTKFSNGINRDFLVQYLLLQKDSRTNNHKRLSAYIQTLQEKGTFVHVQLITVAFELVLMSI